MVLYIFPLGILYSHFPYSTNHVFNRLLDHLPVQNICFRLLFHLLFICGIAHQIMLKFLPSLLLRLMYHTSMVAIHVAFSFVT